LGWRSVTLSPAPSHVFYLCKMQTCLSILFSSNVIVANIPLWRSIVLLTLHLCNFIHSYRMTSTCDQTMQILFALLLLLKLALTQYLVLDYVQHALMQLPCLALPFNCNKCCFLGDLNYHHTLIKIDEWAMPKFIQTETPS